jgi:peroxiredoxin Q/BCP
MPTFKRAKAIVLGISILNEASKEKFSNKYSLTFPLLADEDHAISEKYGVWQKKTRYGRTYMGIVRTTYLIGKNGKVIKRWDKVKVDDHVTEVTETLTLARKR